MNYVIDTHTHSIFSGHAYNTLLGNLDIPDNIQKRLDIIIASLHDVCIDSGSKILKYLKNKGKLADLQLD